jgi:riboflavin synthase
MFTGLIHGVAHIVRAEREGAGGVRLTIDASGIDGFEVAVGDSIALNGACMTATRVEGTIFTVDVSAESLACTAGLDQVGSVNVETSLKLGDKLGGHMVAGHVDGIGEVLKYSPVHESWELVVRAPSNLARYFAYKGSIAVNGVSLTVNRVVDTPGGCEISINIIPHTHEVTTLSQLKVGDRVNLEADLIARYVERVLSQTSVQAGTATKTA